MHRALLLDRDGTIIEDRHYLRDPEQVVLIPGAAEALKRFQDWKLIVVSNQSGIARGLFDHTDVARVHERLIKLLNAEGVVLDGIYYSPDATESPTRKPAPGLGLQAAADHDIDLSQSVVVGDKRSDIEFAKHLGARSVLVLTGYGLTERPAVQADFVCDSLADLRPETFTNH